MAYDTLPDIPPDFGINYAPNANVDRAQFGDGYAQRRPSGINYIVRTESPQWTMLLQSEFAALESFLLARLNLTPFLWQAPWDSAPRQWLCTEVSGTKPDSARFASLSATFQEDFTPFSAG